MSSLFKFSIIRRTFIFLVSACYLGINASLASSISQEGSDDLCQRLNDFDEVAFSLAVKDMEESFKEYSPAKDEQRKDLVFLKENRNALISGIKNGNTDAVNQARAVMSRLDQSLLSNPLLKNKKLLVIRRHFENNARVRMSGSLGLAPTNFQNNSELHNPSGGWDNELVQYEVTDKGINSSLFFKPAAGMIISDTVPHWSGEKIMYSSIGTNNRWHLFELDLKTKDTVQLTPEEYKDFDSFDGCYAPDGSYIFCSTATFLGLPCTNGGNKMCGLFSYDPATKKSRQLTFDQDSNWGPVLMDNGIIMYQRWEYADLPHSNSRLLFTMNPDGTNQKAFYGSNSYFPTAFFGARPIPGKPHMAIGVAGGHHSVSRSGQLLLLDTSKGRKEADGVIAEIPYRGKKVLPEIRDRLPDGKWPQFLHPFPLNDKYFLVSMKRSPKSLWGIYLVDVFNNMTLIAQEENCALLEPVLSEKKPVPHSIPSRVEPSSKTATVFLQNIYLGEGLKGIPHGSVKKLRVGTYSFSPWTQGGLLGSIGLDGPWDVKLVLGEVDVEEDGSVMFTVPANTPIFVQPLDTEGKALQIMRSWFTAMPGEKLSCVGCHENHNSVVEVKRTIASRKKSQEIKPFYNRARGFSFLHEVQPILDKNCISCHDGKEDNRPYFKEDKVLSDWQSQISGHGAPSYAGKFTESYYQLQRYVRRPGIESDMDMLVPMDVHADQTELFQILNKGHHGVVLSSEEKEKLACWIDYNAPFHGRRTDIPEFARAKHACDLKQKYAPMFGVEWADLEWLPERDKVEPVLTPTEQGVPASAPPSLNGWPYYASGSGYGGNHQVALGNYRKSIELAPGVSINLIKVPGGQFIMGSDRQNDEQPLSIQKIEKSFWIGQFEITNAQYGLFDQSHDSRTEHRHGYQFGRRGYDLNQPDQPVVRISWQEAMEFCKWLSEKTGLSVTLPTESQWEWACRAGSGQSYSFGEIGCDYSKFANLGDIRLKEFAACTAHKFYESTRLLDNPTRYDDWIPRDDKFDDGGFVSESVGRYRPNSWDIYDMHGNVWEWTLSSYKSYPYSEEDGRNSVAEIGEKRVVRGGSWYDRPFKATSTYRLPYRGYQKVFNVGFRIVVNE